MRLLILPILYFLSIELVLVRPSLFFWVALALVVATILGVFQISKKKRPLSVICPLMFLIASFFLLPLVRGKFIHFYVGLAALVFWLSFLQLRLFFSSRKRLLAISLDLGKSINLVACFLWFSGIYGLYTNFYASIWLVSLGIILASFFLSFHFLKLSLFNLERFSTSEAVDLATLKVIFPSLIIALIIFQIFWVFFFWPFSWLTIGAVLLIIYYVALDIWQNKFRGTLGKRLILNRLILGSVLIVLVLATTKWLPL